MREERSAEVASSMEDGDENGDVGSDGGLGDDERCTRCNSVGLRVWCVFSLECTKNIPAAAKRLPQRNQNIFQLTNDY